MDRTSISPTISVIIPVFNTADYLVRCLESIINQSINNIEIIIVNDMSTDSSEEIILNYTNKYNFIKYFKMQSKGLAGGSRNLGLTHVTGKYIGFVDSDDWIDRTMFEEMIVALNKHDADIAVCGVITEFSKQQDSEFRYKYLSEKIIEGKTALELLSFPKNVTAISPIVCNKVYRAKFINEHQHTFLQNNVNDDDVFNFICFLTVEKVAIVPNVYYHYYQRDGSIMHTFSNKTIDDFIEGFTIIKNYLYQKEIYHQFKKEYYSFFNRCLASILNILILVEPNTTRQTEIINYLIHRYNESSIQQDYIDSIGIQKIIQFLI
jgi:glycosyltransferase involved in cell wall biosynthesis